MQLDTTTLLLVMIAALVITLVVNYYLIKAAVSASLRPMQQDLRRLIHLKSLELKERHSLEEIKEALSEMNAEKELNDLLSNNKINYEQFVEAKKDLLIEEN